VRRSDAELIELHARMRERVFDKLGEPILASLTEKISEEEGDNGEHAVNRRDDR
jgi:hypothetical protein